MTLAWWFMPPDKRLPNGDGREVIAGETLKIDGMPELCRRGLHASVRPLDALSYAHHEPAWICRVEMGGTVLHGDDKLCATERKTLWMADATRTLHEFAIVCARSALRIGYPDGDVPLASLLALHVNGEWLAGRADKEDLDAARAAAWDAAGDAARAAAWAAAWAAAGAAAGDAETEALNKILTRMLLRLAPRVVKARAA